jgi:hypothetical protein
MVRPRRLTLGGATGAASGDAARVAATRVRFLGLGLGEDAREALRLPVWAFGCDFLVLSSAFLAAIASAFSAFFRSLTTLAFSRATRFSSAILYCTTSLPLSASWCLLFQALAYQLLVV